MYLLLRNYYYLNTFNDRNTNILNIRNINVYICATSLTIFKIHQHFLVQTLSTQLLYFPFYLIHILNTIVCYFVANITMPMVECIHSHSWHKISLILLNDMHILLDCVLEIYKNNNGPLVIFGNIHTCHVNCLNNRSTYFSFLDNLLMYVVFFTIVHVVAYCTIVSNSIQQSCCLIQNNCIMFGNTLNLSYRFITFISIYMSFFFNSLN